MLENSTLSPKWKIALRRQFISKQGRAFTWMVSTHRWAACLSNSPAFQAQRKKIRKNLGTRYKWKLTNLWQGIDVLQHMTKATNMFVFRYSLRLSVLTINGTKYLDTISYMFIMCACYAQTFNTFIDNATLSPRPVFTLQWTTMRSFSR